MCLSLMVSDAAIDGLWCPQRWSLRRSEMVSDAACALLRRWERLRVGERSSGARPLGTLCLQRMASPPTLPLMRQCRRSRFLAWHLPRMRCLCAVATLGSVASYAAAYVLLRRWERLRVGERSSGMASPPTLPPVRCCVASCLIVLCKHVKERFQRVKSQACLCSSERQSFSSEAQRSLRLTMQVKCKANAELSSLELCWAAAFTRNAS